MPPVNPTVSMPKRNHAIFVLIALVYTATYFFSMAATHYYWDNRFASEAVQPTSATIIDLNYTTGKHGKTYFVSYKYQDTKGTWQQRSTQAPAYIWNQNQIGDALPVRYLVSNPMHSRATFEGNKNFAAQLYTIEGVFFLVISVLGLRRKPSPVNLKHLKLTRRLETSYTPGTITFKARYKFLHWVISFVVVILGAGLLYDVIYLPFPGSSDDTLVWRIFISPPAILLIALPFVLRFRPYVKSDNVSMESRLFLWPQKVDWVDLKDIWIRPKSSDVQFESDRNSLVIYFALFPDECRTEISKQIKDLYGESL